MLRGYLKENQLDPHYTPAELAGIVIATSNSSMPAQVLDLTAGNGSLLLAARSRWPSSELYGADIDPRTVSRLRRAIGPGRATRCDVMNPEQRRTNKLLRSLTSNINVLLLNPPFSGREVRASLSRPPMVRLCVVEQ